MKRITKERKSSIIGGLILVGAFGLLWFEKIDVPGFCTIAGIGIGLLISKDKWFNISKTKTPDQNA